MTSLLELTDQIRREVEHLTDGAPPTADSYRQQAAISLMARLPVMMSSAVFSALKLDGVVPNSSERALSMGAGICGHHVEIGSTVLSSLAVPWRDIQVFYRKGEAAQDHTVIEVEWGDAWRMVDVTWGFIPCVNGSLDQALSYEEAAHQEWREGIHHSVVPWRRHVEWSDIFSYLTNSPDAVYVSGEGVAHLRLESGVVDFPHPSSNVIGATAHLHGKRGDRVVRIHLPEGRWRLLMDVEAAVPGELASSGQRLRVDQGRATIEMGSGRRPFVDMRFDPDGDGGYVELIRVTGQQISAGSLPLGRRMRLKSH